MTRARSVASSTCWRCTNLWRRKISLSMGTCSTIPVFLFLDSETGRDSIRSGAPANENFSSGIIRERTAKEEYCSGCFFRCAKPTKRARALYRVQQSGLHSMASFVTVHLHFGVGTGNRLYQSRTDQTEAR